MATASDAIDGDMGWKRFPTAIAHQNRPSMPGTGLRHRRDASVTHGGLVFYIGLHRNPILDLAGRDGLQLPRPAVYASARITIIMEHGSTHGHQAVSRRISNAYSLVARRPF